MTTDLQWRRFYTLVYSKKGRDAAIIPIPIKSPWVRIELTILTFPPPTWYQAGWLNQTYVYQGKPYIAPGVLVPLAPSVYQFDTEHLYQVRFNPVPYLPPAIVTFYRSI